MSLASCSFNVDYEGTSVLCNTNADCLKGVCSQALGRCVRMGVESERPVVEVTGFTPALGRVGTRFEVEVRSSEALALLPEVVAEFDRGGRVVFTTDDPVGAGPFRFSWVVPKDSPNGTARLQVVVVDRFGNEGSLQSALTFEVDTRPPRASVAGIALVAPPLAPSSQVRALAAGGHAVVSFSFDEPVEEPVELTAVPDFVQCVKVRLPTAQATFQCAVDPTIGEEGSIELFVRARDLAGNTSDERLVTVPSPFLFDTVTPSLSADAGLLFVRVPNGTPTTDGRPRLEVRAPEGAVAPGVLVQVYDALGIDEVGRGWATDAGSFSIPLRRDSARVSVRVSDGAGNASPVVPVKSTEFRDVAGFRAVTATMMGAASPKLLRGQARTASVELSAADGRGVTIDGQSSWVRRWTQWFRNPSSGDMAMGFDEARGQAVVQVVGNLLIFNGIDAYRYDQVLPVARGWAAMGYDRLRGVMVLYGGNDTSAGDQTVEMAGDAIRTISGQSIGPGTRTGAVLVWDGTALQLLGDGRTGESWRWDGRRWSALDAGNMPMGSVTAAFDPERRQVVALASFDGGSPQTWRFRDSTWSRVVFDGGPPSSLGSMVWHAGLETVLLNASLADGGAETFQFDSAAPRWSRQGPGLAGLRSPATTYYSTTTDEWLALSRPPTGRPELMVWSPDAGWSLKRRAFEDSSPPINFDFGGVWLGSHLVIHGGVETSTGAVSQDVYRWDQEQWLQAGVSPRPLQAGVMTWLPGRNEVLVAGGHEARSGWSGALTSTWTIQLLPDGGWNPDAGTWVEAPDASLGLRRRQTFFALNPTEAILFGGGDAGAFRVSSTQISQAPEWSVGRPWSRAAASVESPTAVLLSGGGPAEGDGDPRGPLWWWNGSRLMLLDAGISGGRTRHTAVFDDSRREHVLFGGSKQAAIGETAVAEVVRVRVRDGGVQVRTDEVDDPEGDGNPNSRSSSVAGWDRTRKRMVMFGGRNATRTESDLWEYVTEQHRPALVVTIDALTLDMKDVSEVGLEVRVTAGAESELDGGLQPGALVELWYDGRWRVVGVVDGSTTRPTTHVIRLSGLSPDRVWGILGTAALRLTPVGVNGSETATLFVDAFEVAMRIERF